MTVEIDRLETQLQRSFESGAWHGPALLEVLGGLTPDEAFARPIAGAHSVWEIVLHLIGTYHLVLRRLDGDAAPLTSAQDWPVVPAATQSGVGKIRSALSGLPTRTYIGVCSRSIPMLSTHRWCPNRHFPHTPSSSALHSMTCITPIRSRC